MIYTSCYSLHGSNPNAFAISCSIPDWFDKSRHLKFLAPTWEMVDGYKKGLISKEEYADRYIRLLMGREIDPMGIAHNFPDGMILLCYEQPGKFCHRRVLADWVERETGVIIPEWKDPKQAEQDQFVDGILGF